MKNDILRSLSVVSMALALASVSSVAYPAWWATGSKATQPVPANDSQGRILPAQFSQDSAERFNRIEAEMRTLTGQVEELTHELRQLQEQLKRMQEDNEFRFGELEHGNSTAAGSETSAPAAAPEAAGAQEQQVPILPPPGQAESVGAIAGEAPPPVTSGPGAPPRPLGTLTIDGPPAAGVDQPIDLTKPVLPVGPDVANLAPTGDPRADYDRAYGSILNGDYDTAEIAFRQFLAAYPDDALAPDARYWLGESLFVRAQYRDAANEFLADYKAYPKSAKAPDALLKLGLSLAGLGEREAACRTFDAILKQYPDASNALRQRVKFEQSSASC